jgi:hypothetical protein
MERVNLRHLEGLPEAVDVATLDVSFISVLKVRVARQRRCALGVEGEQWRRAEPDAPCCTGAASSAQGAAPWRAPAGAHQAAV